MTESSQKSVGIIGVKAVALPIIDAARAENFYGEVLGFQLAMMFGPRAIMSNGQVILALTPPPDPGQAIPEDRFNENRVGLDHISFGVANRAALDEASELFDAKGVSHGEVNDLGPDLGIYVLAFRDPDNIQLELTAPRS